MVLVGEVWRHPLHPLLPMDDDDGIAGFTTPPPLGGSLGFSTGSCSTRTAPRTPPVSGAFWRRRAFGVLCVGTLAPASLWVRRDRSAPLSSVLEYRQLGRRRGNSRAPRPRRHTSRQPPLLSPTSADVTRQHGCTQFGGSGLLECGAGVLPPPPGQSNLHLYEAHDEMHGQPILLVRKLPRNALQYVTARAVGQ